MSKIRTLALALSAGLILATGTAAAQRTPAQQMCAPRDVLVSNLQNTYSEMPAGRGLSARGNLVELLTSPSGGWTMLMTRPNGMTCVIGVGEAWHEVMPHMAGLSDPVS